MVTKIIKRDDNMVKKWMRTAKVSWNKRTWKSAGKDGYFIKGGKNKGKPGGSWKLFNGRYYSRNNFQVRNSKVKETKSYWKQRDYSVRTKKDGKFTSIYVRPNFEKPKRRARVINKKR